MVTLQDRGDHDAPLPIMTKWLTCLHLFYDGFYGWFYSQWPLIFCYFIEGGFAANIFMFGRIPPPPPSSVRLNYIEFISPSLVCFNFYRIVKILLSCFLAWLGFTIFLFKTWLEVAVPFSVFTLFSYGSWAFSFLTDPVPFFIVFLVSSYSLVPDSCWEGLDARFLFSLDLSNVYWCGTGRSHMDG